MGCAESIIDMLYFGVNSVTISKMGHVLQGWRRGIIHHLSIHVNFFFAIEVISAFAFALFYWVVSISVISPGAAQWNYTPFYYGELLWRHYSRP